MDTSAIAMEVPFAEDVAEILKLPIEERIRLVELIWESIAANPSAVLLSDARRAGLGEEFLAAVEASFDAISTYFIPQAIQDPGPARATRLADSGC